MGSQHAKFINVPLCLLFFSVLSLSLKSLELEFWNDCIFRSLELENRRAPREFTKEGTVTNLNKGYGINQRCFIWSNRNWIGRCLVPANSLMPAESWHLAEIPEKNGWSFSVTKFYTGKVKLSRWAESCEKFSNSKLSDLWYPLKLQEFMYTVDIGLD